MELDGKGVKEQPVITLLISKSWRIIIRKLEDDTILPRWGGRRQISVWQRSGHNTVTNQIQFQALSGFSISAVENAEGYGNTPYNSGVHFRSGTFRCVITRINTNELPIGSPHLRILYNHLSLFDYQNLKYSQCRSWSTLLILHAIAECIRKIVWRVGLSSSP